MESDAAIKAFLMVIGTGLITNPLNLIIKGEVRNRPASTIGLMVLGALVFFSGFFWPQLRPIVGPQFSASLRSVASSAWVWLGVLLVGWLYASIRTIAETYRRDRRIETLLTKTEELSVAVERWVLPRQLSSKQKAQITNVLSKLPSCTITFKIATNDEEAGNFRCDLEEAVVRAGWMVAAHDPYIYASDLQPGLMIEYNYRSQGREDPRCPNPCNRLRMALGAAGIEVAGSCSNSDDDPEDHVILHVGPRRRV